MATIPDDGYEITIVARGGEVIGVVALEGYNLDKVIARNSIINEIQEYVEDDMRLHNEAKAEGG